MLCDCREGIPVKKPELTEQRRIIRLFPAGQIHFAHERANICCPDGFGRSPIKSYESRPKPLHTGFPE